MQSHPEWVRGLKRRSVERLKRYSVSHPEWVRGLKQRTIRHPMLLIASHPEWVRGLKHCDLRVFGKMDLSHPEWVHGLKLLKPFKEIAIHRVAPRVGAWIETVQKEIGVWENEGRPPSGCVD